MNRAKDIADIPRSQQPTRQWQVGGEIKKKGLDLKNYKYDANPGTHGRYYEFDVPNVGKRVIVEHVNDGTPHFHAGKPKKGMNPMTYDFKTYRYSKIVDPITKNHHIYYKK